MVKEISPVCLHAQILHARKCPCGCPLSTSVYSDMTVEGLIRVNKVHLYFQCVVFNLSGNFQICSQWWSLKIKGEFGQHMMYLHDSLSFVNNIMSITPSLPSYHAVLVIMFFILAVYHLVFYSPCQVTSCWLKIHPLKW